MPILIGAGMIAAAILLSTLINALGSRYVGVESPTEESAWLVDRLTGSALSMPGAGTRPGLLRGFDRNRQHRGAGEALKGHESGLLRRANPTTLPGKCPARSNPFP